MADVVCGQWILRCTCTIVNWNYVTVVFGRLIFDIKDVVCVVRGHWDVNIEILNGIM